MLLRRHFLLHSRIEVSGEILETVQQRQPLVNTRRCMCHNRFLTVCPSLIALSTTAPPLQLSPSRIENRMDSDPPEYQVSGFQVYKERQSVHALIASLCRPGTLKHMGLLQTWAISAMPGMKILPEARALEVCMHYFVFIWLLVCCARAMPLRIYAHIPGILVKRRQ